MKEHYDISMPPRVCFPSGQVLSVRPAFVAAVAAGVAWMVFFFVDPAMQSFLPPCLFHAFTGLYCPGCGRPVLCTSWRTAILLPHSD